MKAFKTVTIVAALIGIFLIISAFAADDFYVIGLHEPHALAWDLIIYGAVLCLPMLVVGDRHD